MSITNLLKLENLEYSKAKQKHDNVKKKRKIRKNK